MLLEHPAYELRCREGLHLLDYEAMPADNPPAPDVEDLHRRDKLVLGDREGVEVLRGIGHHLLALDREADRGQTVTQARRPLELELPCRPAHLGFEAVDDRLGVAVEKLHQLLHEPAVLLGPDRGDARARAPLDVVQQAGSPEELVAPELGVRARPDRERPQQQVERLPDRVRVRVGAEIAGVLPLRASHDRGLGPLVADGDREVRVALVVNEADVEARPVGLYQVVLEHDGLDVAGDDDPLDRCGPFHHLSGTRVQVNRILEVAREPAAQRQRLADIDDPAGRISELV